MTTQRTMKNYMDFNRLMFENKEVHARSGNAQQQQQQIDADERRKKNTDQNREVETTLCAAHIDGEIPMDDGRIYSPNIWFLSSDTTATTVSMLCVCVCVWRIDRPSERATKSILSEMRLTNDFECNTSKATDKMEILHISSCSRSLQKCHLKRERIAHLS